jgi:Protein of unknown function (DUF2789)
MEQPSYTLADLFAQLGLPGDEPSIRQFCATHILDDEIRLADANFWSGPQAQFLRDGWKNDSDWVMVIDQLNACLRKRKT